MGYEYDDNYICARSLVFSFCDDIHSVNFKIDIFLHAGRIVTVGKNDWNLLNLLLIPILFFESTPEDQLYLS